MIPLVVLYIFNEFGRTAFNQYLRTILRYIRSEFIRLNTTPPSELQKGYINEINRYNSLFYKHFLQRHY